MVVEVPPFKRRKKDNMSIPGEPELMQKQAQMSITLKLLNI